MARQYTVTEKSKKSHEKNFSIPENQKVWEKFCSYMNEQGRTTSINQYKPGMLALEELTNKKFSEVTHDDLEELNVKRDGKNMVHINGFYLVTVEQKYIVPEFENLKVWLLPKKYRFLFGGCL
jgi:hypothetical protein